MLNRLGIRLSRAFVTVSVSMLAAMIACAAPAHGQEQLDAEPRFAGERLVFTVSGAYTNYVLSVAGPESYYAQIQGARSAPTLRLRDHGAVPDGLYQWQLSAATNRMVQGAARMDQTSNGREPGAGTPRIGAQTSGAFRVEDGRIMIFDDLTEPAPGAGEGG
ncbi:MAG: hypothetical protein RIA71_16485 [Oceanicaulis sp.]